jgi:hypothetical protein
MCILGHFKARELQHVLFPLPFIGEDRLFKGGMGFVLLGKVILPQGALGEHTHARDNLCFLDRQTLPGACCCAIMEWRIWSFSGNGNFPVLGM